MPPRRAFPQEATIEHYGPGAGDVEGTRQLVGTERARCNLQAGWRREDTANRDQESEQWNLYLPAGTALGHQDRVVVGDVTLEVIGGGRPCVDFSGRPHHVEAVLRRAE